MTKYEKKIIEGFESKKIKKLFKLFQEDSKDFVLRENLILLIKKEIKKYEKKKDKFVYSSCGGNMDISAHLYNVYIKKLTKMLKTIKD
jgi:hypothetical protein